MRSLLFLPLVSALSALVLAATVASARAQDAAGTPVTAQPLVVERVTATFVAHGTLQDLPRKLYFKESGTLLSFDAEEGQRGLVPHRVGKQHDHRDQRLTGHRRDQVSTGDESP